MNRFRIGLAQCRPRLGDPGANLDLLQQQLECAAKGGADLVLFPELGLSGYRLDPAQLRLAEPRDGPSMRRLQGCCRALQVACVVSYPELDRGRHHIAASFIDRDGELAGHYRKTHLYAGEKQLFLPGDALAAFDTSFGRVGLMICYDLEFPEVARSLKHDGAELLLVATANMVPFQNQQRVLVQARAYENEVPVAICNRVGREGDLHFFGASGVAHASGAWAELPADRATLEILPVHPEPPPYGYQAQLRPRLYRTG
jgi:predicted amidohydrolase